MYELHEAIRSKDVGLVLKLIEQGADVNELAVGNNLPFPIKDRRPLSVAGSSRNVEIVRALLNAGADPNIANADGTPILIDEVSLRGNSDVFKALLSAGADIHVRDATGKTTLHRVVRSYNYDAEAAKMLVKAGVDVNSRDNDGNTVIHWAALNEHAHAIRHLVKLGVDVNARNNAGETALHTAVMSENEFVIGVLLAGGADPDIVDSAGNLPLHYIAAAEKENGDAIQLVAMRTYGIDLIGADGDTALHIAVGKSRIESVKSLIKFDADINSRNASGKSVVEAAKGKYKSQIIKYIVKYGYKPTAPDFKNLVAAGELSVAWELASPDPKERDKQIKLIIKAFTEKDDWSELSKFNNPDPSLVAAAIVTSGGKAAEYLK